VADGQARWRIDRLGIEPPVIITQRAVDCHSPQLFSNCKPKIYFSI
jgi:hypothetical protein